MARIEFRAMGCRMAAVLDASTPRAAERLRQVPAWFEQWERRLSRFRSASELSELNRRGAGRVSRTVWTVVRLALMVARKSDGLVVPSLLTALEESGYDRNFCEVPSAGACPNRPCQPSERGDWKAIVMDARTRDIRLPAGVRLDLGGIAKGWAADRAAARLAGSGPALVDAGGDISMIGSPHGHPGWPIGVADPASPDAQLALLCVARGGVATSGRDYRRWKRDGVWRHHILDPRTGQPAQTDVLTVTVVGPSAEQAEYAAKIVFVLGAAAGLTWLDERPEFAGLVVRENGEPVASRQLHRYLWS